MENNLSISFTIPTFELKDAVEIFVQLLHFLVIIVGFYMNT